MKNIYVDNVVKVNEYTEYNIEIAYHFIIVQIPTHKWCLS